MDFRVIDMPIEPIETRYSVQWATWFPLTYERTGLPYSQINAAVQNAAAIGTERFLDPMDTFHWKFTQLKTAISTIKMYLNDYNPGSIKRFVLFLHDAWFPGIECFKYIGELLDIPIGIVGFWHAGSYIPEDPLGWNGLHPWMRGSETSWFKQCDAVCVGSYHHKEMILSALGENAHDSDKVHVTGYPVEVPKHMGYRWGSRANRVVWPHRVSQEKHPEMFDLLADQFKGEGIEFVRTLDVCKTKSVYYEMLASSKVAVSTASLETFGISMVEAALSGCVPICPDKLAYRETMPQSALYSSFDELVGMVRRAFTNAQTLPFYYAENRYAPEVVCGNICNIIKEVGNTL